MATAKPKDKKSLTEGVPFYKRHWIPLLIFSFSFLLYANTISNDYNLDDELVTRNHKLTSKGLSAVPEIFTSPYYSDDMGYSYDYRPIVHLTFAIEHQFFGESPHVSHFFNVLLFAALCALLYYLLKALLPIPELIITTAVLLFAAHPVHTEVVASIKNRDELLMFFFSAVSLWALVKYLDTKPSFAIMLSILSFLVALLSKSTAIPFAFLIPLSIIFYRKVSFAKYLLLSFLLSAVSGYIINNTDLLFKLKIFSLLLTGNILAWVGITLIQKTITWQQLKQRFKNIVNSTPSEVVKSDSPNIYSISFSTPKGVQLLALLSVYIVLVAGVWGMFFNMFWLPRIAVALCAVFVVFSNARNSIWFIAPFTIFTLLILQKFDLYGENIAGILFLCLIPLFYLIDKKTRWVIVVLMVLYAINQRTITNSLFYLTSVLFIAVAFEGKRRKQLLATGMVLAIIVLGGVTIHSAIKGVYKVHLILYFLSTFGMLIWYYRSNNQLNLLQLLAGTTLLLFYIQSFGANNTTDNRYNVFNTQRSVAYNSTYKNLHNPVNDLRNVSVQGPVSVSVDRPLNFIETPVPLGSSIKERVLLALDVFMRYAKLLVYPHPLLFYYGYKIIEPIDSVNAVVVFSLLFHITLLSASIYYINRKPVIAWAVLFYLAFMLTLGNIFISIPGVIGERYLLVPSLAFCILLAYLIIEAAKYIANKQGKSLTVAAKWIVVPILIVYGCATIYRNSLWKDDITLFSHDIIHAQESAQAHNLLAIHLMQKSFNVTDASAQTDMRKQALYHFQQTNRIYPTMFNAAYDIGRAYTVLNMPDSAIAAYKYASTLDTNFYNIQLSIAELYYAQQKYEEAIPYLEYCIQHIPNYYATYERLSYILFLKKQYRESVAVNKLAIKNIPNTAEPYVNIVRTFIGENRIDSARYYAAEGYRIAPQNPMVQQMVRELGVAVN